MDSHGTESPERAVEAGAARLIAAFEGEAAFFARNLTTGAEIGYRPDRVGPTASTIKLLVLAELFRQVEAGAVRLDGSVTLLPEDWRGGSGILKDLSPEVALSVRDHAVLMTALSDNVSTAALVRLLGRERILESGRAWGMTNTVATFGGSDRDYATGTPRDFVTLLTLIGTDTLVSPRACAAIRDILVTQQYHDQLARYLPFSPYAREGAHPRGPTIVRSKSGFSAGASGGVRTDAGLIDAPGGVRYAICTMTEGSPDRGFGPEHPGAILNGRISRLVYDAWVEAAP
jgi:beta-lactamase class A